MRVGGQRRAPAALPRDRSNTHCIWGWVGPRADGRVWKISLPPGFDPRTVQPVASRYTDWAIPAPYYQSNQRYLLYFTIQINLLIDVLCFLAIKSELPYRE